MQSDAHVVFIYQFDNCIQCLQCCLPQRVRTTGRGLADRIVSVLLWGIMTAVGLVAQSGALVIK